MYQVSQYFNFYNGHIVLKYTVHFVYGPLNPYVYVHWILTLNILLLLILHKTVPYPQHYLGRLEGIHWCL